MPLPDPTMLEKIVEYAWAGVAALIAFFWKSNAAAIAKAQSTADAAMTRVEFNEYAVRAETSRAEVREGIVDLYRSQKQIGESLARIEGKLEK